MKAVKYALLLMAIAIIGICCIGFVTAADQATSTPTTTISTNDSSSRVYTQAEYELRTTMHKLWTDHVVWTRMYIVSALEDAPDADAAAARLLKNQEDLGDAIKPIYGEEAGDNLTALLTDHILIAVDIVNDVKANNTTSQETDEARWSENADDIASFLAEANPYLPEDVVQEALYMHLATTKDEVVARVEGNYTADIEAYDSIYDHILNMSDVISEGIVQQFPERFGK